MSDDTIIRVRELRSAHKSQVEKDRRDAELKLLKTKYQLCIGEFNTLARQAFTDKSDAKHNPDTPIRFTWNVQDHPILQSWSNASEFFRVKEWFPDWSANIQSQHFTDPSYLLATHIEIVSLC